MTVIFRTDASSTIGSGHVMRCLTLAQRLKELKQDTAFVCRDLTETLAKRIVDEGHRLILMAKSNSINVRMKEHVTHASWLSCSWEDDAAEFKSIATQENAKWLVVDHYGLDGRWESAVSTEGRKLAVIDDLADRLHSCDLLVDQNFRTNPHERYGELVSYNCQMLLGPRYALLRPEFMSPANASIRKFKSQPVTILIAFGGVDLDNYTERAVEELARIHDSNDHVDVVVSSDYPSIESLVQRCESLGWKLHVDTSDMARLMRKADIAIGAGGGMLWERAATGLPAIVAAVSDNQEEQVTEAVQRGLILKCDREMFCSGRLGEIIATLKQDTQLRQRMSESCQGVIDGRGALRVARRLTESEISFRPATESDRDDLYLWRNSPQIRLFSRDPEEISFSDHNQWLVSVLKDPSKRLLIAEDDQGPLGVVRFDLFGRNSEISVYLVPDRIGFGFGAGLLVAAGSWARSCIPEVKEISAEVAPANQASMELFKTCGYRFENGRFVKRLE